MAFPLEKYVQWSAGIALMKNILGFSIALIFIATCYFGIRKYLLKTNSYGKNRITSDQVLKMVASFLLAFIIYWLPFHIVTFLDAMAWMAIIDSCDVITVIDLVLSFAILLEFTNSCINPFLCFFWNHFQQKLRSMFRVPITCFQGKKENMSHRKGNSFWEMTLLFLKQESNAYYQCDNLFRGSPGLSLNGFCNIIIPLSLFSLFSNRKPGIAAHFTFQWLSEVIHFVFVISVKIVVLTHIHNLEVTGDLNQIIMNTNLWIMTWDFRFILEKYFHF